MADTPYKLRVKIHGAEFDAEGDKDSVMEQYRLFLEAQKIVGAALPITPPPALAVASALERPAPPASEPPVLPPPLDGQNGGVPPELFDRVFSRERNVISLRVLPQGGARDADALLLLLYGYSKLKGDHDVYGTQLMKAAQMSGLNIDRIDRIISHHHGLYIRGGARRGTRYALNNQGEAKARTIMVELFQ